MRQKVVARCYVNRSDASMECNDRALRAEDVRRGRARLTACAEPPIAARAGPLRRLQRAPRRRGRTPLRCDRCATTFELRLSTLGARCRAQAVCRKGKRGLTE